MSNTTSNIQTEYTSLASKGNLHDFTASELYDIGSASFVPYNNTGSTKCISYDPSASSKYKTFNFNDNEETKKITVNKLFAGSNLPLSSSGEVCYIPMPEQEHFGETASTGTYIRTYHLMLDVNTSTGLYHDFAEQYPNSEYVNFTYRVIKTYTSSNPAPTTVRSYQTMIDNWNAGTPPANPSSYASGSLFSSDYQAFTKYVSEHTQSIFSIMTTTNTPLATYIDTKYKNEVDYRFFKSLNVTATEDKIYYKIINSNPTDTIDSMVLFVDSNGRYGNNLFDTNDWHPYDSEVVIYDNDGVICEPGKKFSLPNGETLPIPSSFNEVAKTTLYSPDTIKTWDNGLVEKYIYSQILRIRFKRMYSGDLSTDKLTQTLKNLASINATPEEYYESFCDVNSDVYKSYSEYFNSWYGAAGESITISSNGNVVFSWVESMGTPQTCTISNWTSRFSIINPQYLTNNTSKRVLDPSVLNDFIPFREWHKSIYGNYPSGEINQQVVSKWFNTLNQDQFAFWINPTTKAAWSTMSYDIPNSEPVVMHRGTSGDTNLWNGIDKQFIAECGGYNQIIWGCGLTPDFMYPVVDITRPTPNVATECLVYCNNSGYQTIQLAFVNSATEEYLIAKFKSGVSGARRQEIVNDINTWAKEKMIFPDGINSAYFAQDTSNVLSPAGFRVSYIPSLVGIIQALVAILCTFIGILCLIICFVIIKRYVENNRINIGIMRANGIKKWKIAVSLLPFAFFPALIGGISAYFTGLFLQAPALSLFKDYWMLPTPLIQFDWVSFLASIFLPFIVFGAICFITTLIVLRVNSVELMKAGSEFKANSFSRVAKKPFKYFGILTRFRVALAFNSISRLLMLAVMSCLTMSSLVFSFTTFDKLNASRVTNSTQFDYNFNVQLTTPTASGGPYSLYDYSELNPNMSNAIKGFGWTDENQYIFNTSWNTTYSSATTPPEWKTEDKVNHFKNLTKWYALEDLILPLDDNYKNTIGKNGNLMYPTSGDATGQNEDLMYLQNKWCSRLTLDYNIGLPGVASSNPWEIALALMPSNSRNIAADSFNTIINKVGHYVMDADKAFWEDSEIIDLKNHSQVTSDKTVYANDTLLFQTYYSIEKTKNIVHNVANKIGKWFNLYNYDVELDTGTYWKNTFPQYFSYDEETDTYTLNTDISVVGYWYSSFKTSFIKLIRTIYTDKELVELEYPITYGNVPVNWDKKDEDKKDETYTYITANIKQLSNNRKIDPADEITIEGICDDSQYIKLTDDKQNDLNSWLYSENYTNHVGANERIHPIIVNAYAAHKYGLNIGDTITINATNTVDRYEQKLHPEMVKENTNEAQFIVVGISQGTNGAAFYTTQSIANDVLGLPNGRSWNKTHKYMMWSSTDWGSTKTTLPQLIDLAGVDADKNSERPTNKTTIYKFTNDAKTEFAEAPVIDNESTNKLQLPTPIGFNGIYTNNTSGKPITTGVSLYSYTGMYPGTSVYKSNGNNKFAQILKFGCNLSIANLMTGINDLDIYKVVAEHLTSPSDQSITAKLDEAIDKFINKVTEIYGDTTMITAICGGMDVAASDLIYNNLISTFNLAETSIMAIIIPITIIIVAIISNLIIIDSRKMIAMLKALGYSDAKNLMSILALFIPTIVIGLGLSIPLALGLTIGYQSLIFTSANILVDVTQKWWYYAAAIGGIGIILMGTYGIGYASIKKARLVDEIK